MKQHSYFYSVFLMSSILFGGIVGYYGGNMVPYLAPIGEIFLNLILTSVVPLVFFSVASAMTKFKTQDELKRTLLVFFCLLMGLGAIAAIVMLIFVLGFPPAQDMVLPSLQALTPTHTDLLSKLPALVTAPQFGQLFTTTHMLALIIFSMLVGLSARRVEQSTLFVDWLANGEQVFIQLFSLIMKLAPLGFFAYFAGIIHNIGPQIVNSYLRVTILYYAVSLGYFVVVFTAYAYALGGKQVVKSFWSNVFLPGITAIATCSSAATIPANCEALKKMGVPSLLAETLIPLGTMLHKQGSIMGSVVKIAFLFTLFHMPMTDISTLLTIVAVSIVMGTVMGAIPSGGMLGELFILNVYGFPPAALFLIVTISVIIDPPATLLNVTGNTMAGLIMGRLKLFKR